MLKLNATSREAFWLDVLPGVRIRLRPISVAAMLVARARIAEQTRNLGDAADEDERNALVSAVLTSNLARSGIVEWEGIIGADGLPAPVTRENIDAALSVWKVFDAIDRFYVNPFLLGESEKNASAPSPNGISEGATDIAAPAA